MLVGRRRASLVDGRAIGFGGLGALAGDAVSHTSGDKGAGIVRRTHQGVVLGRALDFSTRRLTAEIDAHGALVAGNLKAAVDNQPHEQQQPTDQQPS